MRSMAEDGAKDSPACRRNGTRVPKIRACSWESRQIPTLPHGVRLLALVLADVAEQIGSGPVNRSMLVQVQSSALGVRPDGVADRTGPSEGPGSIPGRDTRRKSPAGVPDSTTVFGTARRGSIPRRGTDYRTSSECGGILHATLRRSMTRFDSWRGHCGLPSMGLL